ncbi:MAG: hypothetical protein U1A24_14435 [Cypionkella sp.]|uniref:hypothetical protein n=1 Tax=Cypionkella sp. TaxID=2811411 RepID=UPI002ABA6750|nr:hypothetical protein [Cypionkella sp.]MDZ4311739.1 hypothetical protein [Cypionkella sp.]
MKQGILLNAHLLLACLSDDGFNCGLNVCRKETTKVGSGVLPQPRVAWDTDISGRDAPTVSDEDSADACAVPCLHGPVNTQDKSEFIYQRAVRVDVF